MYSTDPNKGADVEYKCDSEKEQCKCLESKYNKMFITMFSSVFFCIT